MNSSLSPYDTLFQQRYRGANNVRGIQFQQVYFSCFCFDLYTDTTLDYVGYRFGCVVTA